MPDLQSKTLHLKKESKTWSGLYRRVMENTKDKLNERQEGPVQNRQVNGTSHVPYTHRQPGGWGGLYKEVAWCGQVGRCDHLLRGYFVVISHGERWALC